VFMFYVVEASATRGTTALVYYPGA
jgi:hypothetical protein